MDSFLIKREASAIVASVVACGAIVLAETRPLSAAASPTLTTQASSPVLVGGSINDTAVLSGGASPAGMITFKLFNAGGCPGSPIFTSTKTVTGNGSYASDLFVVPATGSYYWVASYGGDANNNPASNNCGDSPETVDAPQYCPPARCTPTNNSCVKGLASTTSTSSCAGSAAHVTTITREVVGPAILCIGDGQSIPFVLCPGAIDFDTKTETVSVSVAAIPTLSVWGLGALLAALGAVAVWRLRLRQG